MNNKSDMQNSNTQGHTINDVPNNWDQTGNTEQTTTNRNIDRLDESIKSWTCYGRLSGKLDRVTCHYCIANIILCKLSLYHARILYTFTDAAYYNIMLLEEGGSYRSAPCTLLYLLVYPLSRK